MMGRVDAGAIDVVMDHDARFCEGGGALHGGAVTAGMDTACASCAVTLLPQGWSLVTAELKTSFLRPALGDSYRFEGRVLKPGRSLIFTEGRCWAITGERAVLAATMTATMAVIRPKHSGETS